MLEIPDKMQMSYPSKSSTQNNKQDWWWCVHVCGREKLRLGIVLRSLKVSFFLFFLIFYVFIAWDYIQQIRKGSHLICLYLMCQHTRSSVIATKPFYTRMLLFYIASWDTKLFFLFCKILIGMQRHEWITALKIPNVVACVYQSWSLIFHLQSESVISKIPSTIKWKGSFLSSLFLEEASLELGYCWSNSGNFSFVF